MWAKIVLLAIVVAGYSVGTSVWFNHEASAKADLAMKQFSDPNAATELRQAHLIENNLYLLGWALIVFVAGLVFLADCKAMARKVYANRDKLFMLAIAPLTLFSSGCGCRRPFEPVKLEVIHANEAAFLLPFKEAGTSDEMKKKIRESSSNNEAYLRENLVFTKQVQIPQQWVPSGYETFGPKGEWTDSALLVKVDMTPVTCEWTADPTTGTSSANEAIWVMTADQVEFSTGWTITARIAGHDDAVKFLHNYRNGSLKKVLDTEVRGRLQAEFGIEVTDLPMQTLRINATPHLKKTVKAVTDFFSQRGISITNLGITGGFIYKDKSIVATMVRSFNAEQEQNIAKYEKAAQDEKNRTVISEAMGKADAILKTKKAEADGIKMLADAKLYELEKAKENVALYVQLKQLELQRDLLQKWDGAYPRYFLGSGGHPNMLMQMPVFDEKKSGK